MNAKRIFNYVLLAIAGGVVLQACDKNDNDNLPDKVKKVMHTWKITDITVPKAAQAEVDSSIIKTCMADDLIKFTSSGFDFDDVTNKCDSTVFFYSKGAWAYNTAQDSIQLGATTPQKYLSWKVLLLNDSIMKVRYTDSLNPAKKLTKTISFKR